jgi:acetyltransferase-like isoleucine patch superfamily enzyme
MTWVTVETSQTDAGRAGSVTALESDMLEQLRSLQKELQATMRASRQKRVSFGDLVTDRWENARESGFGDGTSCYDNVLIIGDVKIGSNTWIGPNVILDGSGGGLSIGNYCSISAGVQIYTHNTVNWATSLGAMQIEKRPTIIGSGVYIGPNSILTMGLNIGDHVIIGAMSFVDKDIPSGKKAWGCPARVVGDVDPTP